jgi:hypothetical protein
MLMDILHKFVVIIVQDNILLEGCVIDINDTFIKLVECDNSIVIVKISSVILVRILSKPSNKVVNKEIEQNDFNQQEEEQKQNSENIRLAAVVSKKDDFSMEMGSNLEQGLKNYKSPEFIRETCRGRR